jgi:hypothetical protein
VRARRLFLDISAITATWAELPAWTSLWLEWSDGSCEGVCGVETYWFDHYGGMHSTILEPEFRLFVRESDGAPLILQDEDLVWIRPDRGDFTYWRTSSAEGKALLASVEGRTPVSVVKAADAEIQPYRRLPQWIEVENGESDETERLVGVNSSGFRYEIGRLKDLASPELLRQMPQATLDILNEGALVTVDDYAGRPELGTVHLLLRPGTTAFERVTDPELLDRLLRAVKRRPEHTYRTPVGAARADRHKKP